MKKIQIIHDTCYSYHEPVHFGPHRAMMRPREGHDLHIAQAQATVEPAATIRWSSDIYGNSIALLTFSEPADKLRIASNILVDIYDDQPIDHLIEPFALSYPFEYAAHEQIEIMPYRLPSYPHEGPAVKEWLLDLYRPGQLINTSDLLLSLNTRIFESFQYIARESAGVQLPCQTLSLGTGSCRDYAVFMMEAARHWGFAARFVTGYIQMADGQHGATHAWTEIYIPGAGWRGFDPTNNKLAGIEHVAVAVAREQEKAMPLSGYWDGPANAFKQLDVSVQVFEV